MTAYHYTECGLDNVYIEGLNPCTDDEGDEIIAIPAVAQLHTAIAHGLVEKPFKLTGKELRFLRSEMGLTQVALGEILHVTGLTISRWEREECELDSNAETVVRILANELLKLNLDAGVKNLSAHAIHEAGPEETIRINGSNACCGEYSVRVA